MAVPLSRQEMGRGAETMFNVTIGGSVLEVALLFLTHGFLPKSPGSSSVNKENDVKQPRRIFLARSRKVTYHILHFMR